LARSPKPRTLDTTLLALELLQRIPRHGKTTATELRKDLAAAGFHRDIRSIQRLLDQLADHFPHIERDERTKPFGYSRKAGMGDAFAPRLSEQESMLFLLAREQLAGILPPAVLRALKPAFAAASTKLDARHRVTAAQAKSWPSKVRVVSQLQPLLPPRLAAGVFEAVTQALYADHWLQISYVNQQGKATEARVMPLGLGQQGVRLFVVVRFEDHDDERNLAMHRIRKAIDTGLPFERPVDFDLGRYDDEQGGFGFGRGRQVRLHLTLPAGRAFILRETPLAADQQEIVRRDGRIEFVATVTDSARLDWWIATLGGDVSARKKGILSPNVGPEAGRQSGRAE
jgi:predicted DNA-binding transcriptional regulator YafY